jgi:Branched-chain amino acid aminotransferase/4-amino-4-deoxychorismate lyase
MEISLDKGLMFGMGVFETIAINNKKPLFLEAHLRRLEKGLQHMRIDKKIKSEDIEIFILKNNIINGAVRIIVSEKNTIITTRENPYTEEMYKTGYSLLTSSVKRNETSPLTYLKTCNYSDNILEKEKAIKNNYDDSLFVNSKDFVCETSSSNIFYVKKGKICTPIIHCGLLPGVVRDYIITKYEVIEEEIPLLEIFECEEIFITNSLLGIMPVHKIDDKIFPKNNIAKRLRREYMRNNSELSK